MIIGEAGEAARAIWGDLIADRQKVYGGGGGGGGGFKMAPDELNKVIGKWEELQEQLVRDGSKIRGLLDGFNPPGGDQASGSYVSSGAESLSKLQDQNDSMVKYVANYIKKLKAAQTGVVATDQNLVNPFAIEA